MSSRGWIGWVRYGVPGLVLGLVLAWYPEGRGPSARAQGQTPPSVERPRPAPVTGDPSANGTIAFTTTTTGSAQLLYLIDTKSRAFAVYRVDPSNPKGTVKLEAARQYQWDLKLDEYNNLPPEVAAIESSVKSLGQPKR